MRVLIVATLAGPDALSGGVWEVASRQRRLLEERGHSVSVAAGWLGTTPPESVDGRHVALCKLNRIVPGLGLRALYAPGWKNVIRHQSATADVVHVHLCRDLLTTRAVEVVRQLAIPIVAQPHGMLAKSPRLGHRVFDRLVMDRAARRPRRYIAVNDSEVESLRQFGVPSKQIRRLDNCSPDPGGCWSPVDPPEVLFVSRLHPQKQVHVFAEAVANLRSRGVNVRGRIIGPDHGDLRSLKALIQRAGLQDALIYEGALDRAGVDLAMRRATLVAVPSLAESFGLVIVEALAAGTPVVCTSETPLSRQLVSSESALVGPPTLEFFTQAMERLLTTESLQRQLSQNGRRLYMSHWTPDAIASGLIDIYESAIGD